jgi:hypothetical protein
VYAQERAVSGAISSLRRISGCDQKKHSHLFGRPLSPHIAETFIGYSGCSRQLSPQTLPIPESLGPRFLEFSGMQVRGANQQLRGAIGHPREDLRTYSLGLSRQE